MVYEFFFIDNMPHQRWNILIPWSLRGLAQWFSLWHPNGVTRVRTPMPPGGSTTMIYPIMVGGLMTVLYGYPKNVLGGGEHVRSS